jgi:hypothetical protein
MSGIAAPTDFGLFDSVVNVSLRPPLSVTLHTHSSLKKLRFVSTGYSDEKLLDQARSTPNLGDVITEPMFLKACC